MTAVDARDRILVGGSTLGPDGEDVPGAFLEIFDRFGSAARVRIYPGDARIRDISPDGDDLVIVGEFRSLDLGAGPLPHVGETDAFISRLRVSAA